MDDALDALRANPVAIWLENQVALEERDGELARRRPQRIGEIVEALAHDVGLAFDACRDFLADMLQWISLVNQRMQDGDQRYTVLPFKLHQFISQTGSVYAGLLELRRLPALNHARAAAEKAKIDRPSHSK